MSFPRYCQLRGQFELRRRCEVGSQRRIRCPRGRPPGASSDSSSFGSTSADAIQNLRTALDRLAYQPVCSDTHDAPSDPSVICFPIADDANAYQPKKTRQDERAKRQIIELIDSLMSGNDRLWDLVRTGEKSHQRLTPGGFALKLAGCGWQRWATLASRRWR